MPSTPANLPDYVDIFPEIGMAAVKAKEDSLIVAWGLFRASDSAGQGQVERCTAREILRAARGIQDRQARREIRDGNGRYWSIDKQDRLWLASPATLAQHFALPFLGRPHRIPVADLCGGRSRRRAALTATVYRTDERGRPISRRKVRERTGVAESTQRRYEHTYGHATVVDEVHAQLTHVTRETNKHAILHEYPDSGFYAGGSGDLMRRHAEPMPTLRSPPGQTGLR